MKWWLATILWVVLTSAGLAVSFLPRRLELLLGPWLGRFCFLIGPKRRQVAYDNIRRCFPELGMGQWESILQKNYRHYGILAFELLHLFSPIPGHYRSYGQKNTVVEGLENWKKASDRGKGVLFVASHLGNWELMVAGGALAGIKLTMVTKHLKPEWLHKKIEASRLSLGAKGAYEPRTLPAIMRALRNGESVGFVLDQYAGPPIGIPVSFFGVKVGTLAAVGTLASRTGAAVVPARTYRDERGMVHICMEPELDMTVFNAPSAATDAEPLEVRVTESLAARVEHWVRQDPPQWLWIHRRFKNVVWPSKIA